MRLLQHAGVNVLQPTVAVQQLVDAFWQAIAEEKWEDWIVAAPWRLYI
jgi:hypothetical protein